MPGEGIPTIKWGTFYDRKGMPHIAPVIESRLMAMHVLDGDCFCTPVVNKTTRGTTIFIHCVIH